MLVRNGASRFAPLIACLMVLIVCAGRADSLTDVMGGAALLIGALLALTCKPGQRFVDTRSGVAGPCPTPA